MDEGTVPDYQGVPPPKSSLGAWLLRQAHDLRAAINALTGDADADRSEINKLKFLVDQLLAETKRSAKVQAAQGVELERVRGVAEETQRQLNGVKIFRGMHQAKPKSCYKTCSID